MKLPKGAKAGDYIVINAHTGRPFGQPYKTLEGAQGRAHHLTQTQHRGAVYTVARIVPQKTERDPKSERWISDKIRLLRAEGYPQRQAIAIALRMAGVPRKTPKRKNRR